MTDPTVRALTLLGLLGGRPDWPGPELAARLGVTTRTLRRDVERLRSLGYTVEAGAGAGGGYSLGRGQIVPPLLLDEEQAVAVTLALTRAAQEGNGPDAEAALRALASIDEVMPVALRRRMGGLRDAVTLTPSPGAVGTELLLPCADAVRRSVRLRFGYRDRHGTSSQRTVEPHRLHARGRTWRLVAYDLDRSDWRTFRLDRLTDPEAGTWRFTPRAGLEEALARLEEPTPPEVWRHQAVVHIRAPLSVAGAGLPARAGHLRALDADTTQFRFGADDPAQAAELLARLEHDFTVIGDEAVVKATARLAARLRGAVGGAG